MPAFPKSEGPSLLSYIDLTAGKWQNFRLDPMHTTIRFDGSGRFMIPHTPLYVGAEINLGRGPEDIRFLGGTRIDIGSILGKVLPPKS